MGGNCPHCFASLLKRGLSTLKGKTLLPLGRGSRMDLFKYWEKYAKDLRCPNMVLNMVLKKKKKIKPIG